MPSESQPFFADPGERMGHRWSQQEDDYVFARFSRGDSPQDIANRIGRGESSVVSRLQLILDIRGDFSPSMVRSLAESSGYLMHQATRRLMQGTVKKIEFTCVKAKEKA